jgi:transcriptional regulator with XRE-family HTH domain
MVNDMSDDYKQFENILDNTSMSKEFGLILEDLIRAKNISVRQFAKDIGQKPTTVNEWVGRNGRFPASPENLKAIALYFNISIHELLYGEPDPAYSDLTNIFDQPEIKGLYEITIRKVSMNPKL